MRDIGDIRVMRKCQGWALAVFFNLLTNEKLKCFAFSINLV